MADVAVTHGRKTHSHHVGTSADFRIVMKARTSAAAKNSTAESASEYVREITTRSKAMASANVVILCGNLTRDPEVRQIPSGMSVADLGVAVNESFKDKDGQQRESTVYVDVVTWGRSAEACGRCLRKGAAVLIEGKLQLDTWEKDGEKRSKLRVRADRVQFLGGKQDREGGEFRPPNFAKPAPAAPAGASGSGAGPDDDIPFARVA